MSNSRLIKLVRGILNPFGYTIQRYYPYPANEEQARPDLTPYGLHIYAPWHEQEFYLHIYSHIEGRTVVSPDRCYILDRLAHYSANLPGQMAECGVYQGGTAYLLANRLSSASPEKQLHLFDTFEGMPETEGKAKDGHVKGDFGDTNLEEVQAYLKDFSQVRYHAGIIPKTFKDVLDLKFCLVHVDVDIYRSTYDCLAFFYPRLVKGGVLIIDDYGFVTYRDAAKRAADDLMADKPEPVISLATGQCMMIKL
jgi:hypothetical protein